MALCTRARRSRRGYRATPWLASSSPKDCQFRYVGEAGHRSTTTSKIATPDSGTAYHSRVLGVHMLAKA